MYALLRNRMVIEKQLIFHKYLKDIPKYLKINRNSIEAVEVPAAKTEGENISDSGIVIVFALLTYKVHCINSDIVHLVKKAVVSHFNSAAIIQDKYILFNKCDHEKY